jgi:hypothetical protein
MNKYLTTQYNTKYESIKLNKIKKYPFLNEIIQCNHHYLYKFEANSDFDVYIILMNLYLYTCKYMNENNILLTKDNIYNNMEYLFSNKDFRTKLINTFQNFNKSLNKTTNNYITS